jgi:UDP:flavonoid glycosyltransferase YjiC (YdhE family)
MARIGVFCFAGAGHIYPMTALLQRLQQRGHEAVVFGIADVEARIISAGVEFCQIGESDYPKGTLQKLDRQLAEAKGLETFRRTVERLKNNAQMVLRDGPAAVRSARVDALLVDEVDMAGNVAEYLGLPFISIAVIPPFIRDSRMPPFFFDWGEGRDPLRRVRNQLGIWLLSGIAAPIFRVVNNQRRAWGLKPFNQTSDALSTLAQITQLPAAMEFDIGDPPAPVHYTGPFVDSRTRAEVEFPWERLDGRPMVYASMGTLQNGSEEIFRAIAAGCAGLNVQLVLSLGGGMDSERLGPLAGDPVVVRFAPQLELVKRAAAVITHAGINTTLESLAQGVPLVCIPIGNDQPGVAARVVARGAGVVIPLRRLTARRVRVALNEILEDAKYRRAAQALQSAFQKLDGLDAAADIIERVLKIGAEERAAVVGWAQE